jgi:hypothetical protein
VPPAAAPHCCLLRSHACVCVCSRVCMVTMSVCVCRCVCVGYPSDTVSTAGAGAAPSPGADPVTLTWQASGTAPLNRLALAAAVSAVAAEAVTGRCEGVMVKPLGRSGMSEASGTCSGEGSNTAGKGRKRKGGNYEDLGFSHCTTR